MPNLVKEMEYLIQSKRWNPRLDFHVAQIPDVAILF